MLFPEQESDKEASHLLRKATSISVNFMSLSPVNFLRALFVANAVLSSRGLFDTETPFWVVFFTVAIMINLTIYFQLSEEK